MNSRGTTDEQGLHGSLEHTGVVGQNLSLFQWILAFFFIELTWTFVGGAVTYIVAESTRDQSYSSLPWMIYVIQHVNFLVLIGTLMFVILKAVRVSLARFITDAPRFRWPLFRFSLGVWLAGMSLATCISWLIEPQGIMINHTERLWDRLFLFVLAVVLTPVQCVAEELLFRTMIWRMLEKRVRKSWALGAISGVVFTLAHLTNAEVQSSGFDPLVIAYYFLSGFLFMEMVLRHRGTEGAFGAHIANNIFLVLAVNYAGSSLPGDPWLIQGAPFIWVDLLVLFSCSLVIITVGKRYQ